MIMVLVALFMIANVHIYSLYVRSALSSNFFLRVECLLAMV